MAYFPWGGKILALDVEFLFKKRIAPVNSEIMRTFKIIINTGIFLAGK